MTTVLSRLGAAVAVGLWIFAAAGCRNIAPTASPTTEPAPSASSSAPTPSPSPSPTAPVTDPAIIFQADGIGPYIIGTGMSALNASGLVTKIEESPLCSGVFFADATGRYAGAVTLTFRGGRLTAVQTRSAQFVTPSGARVGMTQKEVQDIYGGRAELLIGALGNKALSVRVPASGLAVILYIHQTQGVVYAMAGGEAQALEDEVQAGEGC